jgi:hypothetical protein
MNNRMVELTESMGTTFRMLQEWLDSPNSESLSPDGRRSLEEKVAVGEPFVVSRKEHGGILSYEDMHVLTGNFLQLEVSSGVPTAFDLFLQGSMPKR